MNLKNNLTILEYNLQYKYLNIVNNKYFIHLLINNFYFFLFSHFKYSLYNWRSN